MGMRGHRGERRERDFQYGVEERYWSNWHVSLLACRRSDLGRCSTGTEYPVSLKQTFRGPEERRRSRRGWKGEEVLRGERQAKGKDAERKARQILRGVFSSGLRRPPN